jgi:uncharacterized protein
MTRAVLWRGTEEWLAEAALVELTGNGVTASGTQLGAEPRPYRLDYRLDAGAGFVTRSLDVDASGEGWSRSIRLTHEGKGSWELEAEAEGSATAVDSGDTESVKGALDCDLEYSPVTNLMPVRRHSIHEEATEKDFLIAFVSVPDLRIHASKQRYEHVSRGDGSSIVRFVSLDSDFRADLELDEDGLVVDYPRLARRVSPGMRA